MRFVCALVTVSSVSVMCCRAIQLTDSGPSVTSELPAGVAGPSFGGAPGSAGFLFFGSLAVNSKMLSRANHGADDANMPANIIAHTPVAITMLKRVILIADTSCLTVLLQIIHPNLTWCHRSQRHKIPRSRCDSASIHRLVVHTRTCMVSPSPHVLPG